MSLLFAILAIASWVYTAQVEDNDLSNIISSEIHEMDQEMEVLIDDIDAHYEDSTSVNLISRYIQKSNLNTDISVFVFSDNTLLAWNDHSVSDLSAIRTVTEDSKLVQLDNGYYLLRQQSSNNIDVYALSLVKNDFIFENDYLQNKFSKRFHISSNPEILLQNHEGFKAIKLHKNALFYISDSLVHDNNTWLYISLFLLLLAIVFLTSGLSTVILEKCFKSVWLLVFVSVVFGLRVGLFYLESIFGFDNLNLFGPEVYASSAWFPSLGDFLISSIFIFIAVSFIRSWTTKHSEFSSNKILAFLSYISVYFIFAYTINVLFSGLVEDSNIAFNINNFFKLSPYSLIGILSMGILLFSLYYLATAVVRVWVSIDNKSLRLIAILAIILTDIILVFALGMVDWIMILLPIAMLLFVMFFNNRDTTSLYPSILLISLITLYTSYMFEKYSEIREEKKIKILADKISINNDQIAEYLYVDIDKYMQGDQHLDHLISDYIASPSNISNSIINEYFKGYWDKYRVHAYLFDTLGVAVLGRGEVLSKSQKDLDNSIIQARYSTPEGLYMVKPSDRHLRYLVDIPVLDQAYHLYIEMEYNFIREDLGFPELLIKGTTSKEYSEYSIARYYNDKLITESGSYPFLIDKEKELQATEVLYHRKGFIHYAIEREPYTFIISKAKDSSKDKLTDFTYLYSIFGILYILFLISVRIGGGEVRKTFSLQIKIQTLVIGIVLISLLLFGFGSYYYIVSQNNSKNENLLREKVSSVLIELSHKLDKEKAMEDDKKIAKYLRKFSNVFFTDINIYSLEGELRATSRPQLFDNGIISTRMHPDAYLALAVDKNSRYTHTEEIGRLKYLSSYVPFYGKNNEVLAYLNLPYFAKQAELEEELSAFVVAIINMLVLMFIISAFGTLFVSRLITNPLKVIEKNLSGISLDKTNAHIEYTGNDEISTLVNAYNKKLDELREKAEELAKSERETAWREMAKQVAHEIKNPLTPMKLSIQYLQKTWEDGSDDWGDRFKRSSTTLIEQIETLSSIATAFGDFAKMPKAQTEKVDLRKILEHVVALFSENSYDSEVIFTNVLAGPQFIIADKDQITRVFNNLVKNALQSIPENQEGRIEVSLALKDKRYIVEVKDNGVGIASDKKDKIFVPNFTTKSTGTGLGLAMVKSIVESIGGEVWFESVDSVGTSFFVSIKKYEE